jgi:hypothetical protein
VSGDGVRSYYGRPILKAPPWTDEIPWYLFTGGLAGASGGLSLAARLAGNDRLARDAMAGAAAGVSASLPQLVHDLGRPARFHHRLRRAAELVAGAVGPALATYTGAPIADTAVPGWHEAGAELPLVFAGGAAASAGGLAAILTPPEAAGPARRLAIGGVLVELGTAEVMRRRLGHLAEPYHQEPARRLALAAGVCGGAGAVLLGLFGRRRAAAAVGGALLLASSAYERFAVYRAGIATATDPSYLVRQQRERSEATPAGSR